MANLILRLCLLCLHSGESLGMSLANGDTKVVDSFSLFFLIRRFWQFLRRKLSMILYLLICDFFTAKQNCPRCWSRWENLDHAQYQPIKFMNSVFPSPCDQLCTAIPGNVQTKVFSLRFMAQALPHGSWIEGEKRESVTYTTDWEDSRLYLCFLYWGPRYMVSGTRDNFSEHLHVKTVSLQAESKLTLHDYS